MLLPDRFGKSLEDARHAASATEQISVAVSMARMVAGTAAAVAPRRARGRRDKDGRSILANATPLGVATGCVVTRGRGRGRAPLRGVRAAGDWPRGSVRASAGAPPATSSCAAAHSALEAPRTARCRCGHSRRIALARSGQSRSRIARRCSGAQPSPDVALLLGRQRPPQLLALLRRQPLPQIGRERSLVTLAHGRLRQRAGRQAKHQNDEQTFHAGHCDSTCAPTSVQNNAAPAFFDNIIRQSGG